MSSSKGSDGHTLAVTVDGQLFSWGDGEFIFSLISVVVLFQGVVVYRTNPCFCGSGLLGLVVRLHW